VFFICISYVNMRKRCAAGRFRDSFRRKSHLAELPLGRLRYLIPLVGYLRYTCPAHSPKGIA
jgi:hypothetical protein